MRNTLYILFGALLLSVPAFAQTDARTRLVDCSKGDSLPDAVAAARVGDTLLIRGACTGSITIAVNGLTLEGLGASIDGQGKTAVTVNGAARTTLIGLEIKNGTNGILGQSGAQLTLANVTLTGNSLSGLMLQSNSSAGVAGGSASNNGLNGIDVEATSSLVVIGSYSVTGNKVFGININNASSLTMITAQLTVSNNVLGIQIGTSAGFFIADAKSKLTVSNNQTTGLTIVSGSHMVNFGGTIVATQNGVHGISVDSKAGLDLDAAALVQSYSNQADGVHLEETSVLTMFNTPAFSGAPGTTTLETHDNAGNGIALETGSGLTVINQATITSTANTLAGLSVDDGSAATVIQSTFTGNSGNDVVLTFGSRGTFNTTAVGKFACDASVLVRGDGGLTCPSTASVTTKR